MPIYLIETDAAFEPLDPPGGWYGPIKAEIAVDWIANERQCDDTFDVVPEIEFPSERHYRRDDWLCVGVRPPRAMPRGLRLTLESDSASGTAPPGLIENPIECWAGDPSAAVRDLADYDNNDGGLPRGTWLFSTDVDSHASNVEPLAYTGDDFVLESVARYVASDGTFWRVLFSPNIYAGASPPLPAEPIASLAIARRTLGRPANKVRSIVLKADEDEPLDCGLARSTLPFFEDFEFPRFGLTSGDGWYIVTVPTRPMIFHDGRAWPLPNTFLSRQFYNVREWTAWQSEIDCDAVVGGGRRIEWNFKIGPFPGSLNAQIRIRPGFASLAFAGIVGQEFPLATEGDHRWGVRIERQGPSGVLCRALYEGSQFTSASRGDLVSGPVNCAPWTFSMFGDGGDSFDNFEWQTEA